MHIKGRFVAVLVVAAMIVSSFLTYYVVNQGFWQSRNGTLEKLDPEATDASAMQSPATSASSQLSSKDLKKIENIYKLIENKYIATVDHDKLLNGAIQGMLNALEDPYTVYMDAAEAEQFNESINSSFEGIGAEVSIDNGQIVIVAPIKGSPAEKAGIQANDIILSVNGEKLEGLTLTQAVLKIRGPKGTQARIELKREGFMNSIFVVVVRDKIDVDTIKANMLENGIGKIEIQQFSTNTADRFKEELAKLEAQGLKGLIIDVRNNPGGLLDVVSEIIEQFVPAGKTILQIENRSGNREPKISNGSSKYYPVSVLINKGSASASEILAASLKETIGSAIVGETTFGKGTVQVTFGKELGDDSNLKMTAYKWLTPTGTWIHKIGIEPTAVVAQPDFFKVILLSKAMTLKPDMIHDDIKNLQLILKGLGYRVDREDGYFSKGTSEIVKLFQQKNNLAVTGQVDVKTASALEKAIIQEIRNPENDLQLKEAIRQLSK
jgi:carboxyl-terminal processing protease